MFFLRTKVVSFAPSGLALFCRPKPTACAVGCILAPLRGWAARLPLVTARLKTCPDTTEHEPKRVSQQKAKAAALEPPLCLLVTFLPVTASNYGTD
jgi:hypothetical protein